MESWVGAAGELLTLLQTLVRDNILLLKKGEQLPKSPDAMGVWLTNNAMRLRTRGIELYRPKPTAQKRLWAWRRVSQANDTSDTLNGQVPGVVSSPINSQDPNTFQPDTSDTLTEEQKKLLDIYNGEQS